MCESWWASPLNRIYVGTGTSRQSPRLPAKNSVSSFVPRKLLVHQIFTPCTYIAQIRASLKYCSHIWGAAVPTTSNILDSLQRRAIRLINNDSALTDKLPSLAQRRAVSDRSFFSIYFHGLCSDELTSIMPPVVVSGRQTRFHPFAVSLATSKTSHFDRTFVPRVSRLLNRLPPHVFPSLPNLQTFKSRINKLPLVPTIVTHGT